MLCTSASPLVLVALAKCWTGAHHALCCDFRSVHCKGQRRHHSDQEHGGRWICVRRKENFHRGMFSQSLSAGLQHPSFNHCHKNYCLIKLEALVPPTTTVIAHSCTIGLGKLSACFHFFIGAQMAVRFVTTLRDEIISGSVLLLTACSAHVSANKSRIICIRTNIILCLGGHAWCFCMCFDAVVLPQAATQTFLRFYRWQCPLLALSVHGPQMAWECVCVDGINLKYAPHWHQFIPYYASATHKCTHTYTRILKPFEDSEVMGLKVDIALQTRPTDIGRLSWVTLIEVQRCGVSLQWHNQLWQSLEEGCVVWCDHEGVPLQWHNQLWQSLEEGCVVSCDHEGVPLQWHNQLWQSLEEGCVVSCDHEGVSLQWHNQLWQSLEEGCVVWCDREWVSLQWCNQLWQSLEEGYVVWCDREWVFFQWRNQLGQSLEEGCVVWCDHEGVSLQWRN